MTCASLLSRGAGPSGGQCEHRACCCLFRYQAINALANQSGMNRLRFLFSPGDADDGRQLRQLIKGHAEQFPMDLQSFYRPAVGLQEIT